MIYQGGPESTAGNGDAPGGGTIELAGPNHAIVDPGSVQAGIAGVALPSEQAAQQVATLTGIVNELTGMCDALSGPARQFVREGGSVETAMEKIRQLGTAQEPMPEIDQVLLDARSEYADALTSRGYLFHPSRKANLEATQATYRDALVAKIEAVTDLHLQDCLEMDEVPLESLVERGLSVLTGTLLTEEQSLQQTLDRAKQNSLINRLVASPKLYRVLLAGLVGASVAIRTGLVPSDGNMEPVVHGTEVGIDSLAAFSFANVAQEKLFVSANRRWAEKQLAKSREAIEKDEDLADDLIEKAVSGVSDDNNELQGARLLVGRLFTNHLKEIKGMGRRRPEEVEIEYAKLIKRIVAEEVQGSAQGIVADEKRTALFRGLSIVGALIAGPIIANIGESRAATKDLETSFSGTN